VKRETEGDLSVTALYTSAAWSWGGLPNAELLEHPRARGVFRAVNGTLALTQPLFGATAPLRVALLHRHALIDSLLRGSNARGVVELAAGLSRRGVSFSSDPALAYVEVDQPHVIATKRELLSRSEAGRAALARENLTLVAADVTATPFDELAPHDRAPLFVIAEGLLMYLDANAQRALARSIASRLARGGGTFVFDYVPPCEQPPAGAVGRGLEWLMKRFTKGQAFAKDTRTRADVIADLLAAGFDRVEAIEPRSVARALDLPYPDAATQQLVFVAHVGHRVPGGIS
jgi:O-methyltransferase involved in polyketide biosynthesis